MKMELIELLRQYGETPSNENDKIIEQLEIFLSTFAQFSSHYQTAVQQVIQWNEVHVVEYFSLYRLG